MELGLWGDPFRFFIIVIHVCITLGKQSTLMAGSDWSSLTSPNFPNDYPNNVNDLYELIATDKNNLVCIKVDTFDLQFSGNCTTHDYVAVQNSLDEHPVGYWCGVFMPPSMCGENGQLYIRFRSDNNVTGAGFKILYSERQIVEEDSPVGMIVGGTVVPVIIFAFLLCYYIRRKKPGRLYTDRVQIEALGNSGSSTQGSRGVAIISNSSQGSRGLATISNSSSSGVNNVPTAPPTYDKAVGSTPAEQPPSYDSLPVK